MANAMRKTRAAETDLRAISAGYEGSSGRVTVEFSNGIAFSIPLARLPEIAHATSAQLGAVTVIGAGTILHWEALDADYSIPALLAEATGTAHAARTLGQTGGRAKSDVKVAAARANGAKGVRPRTKPAKSAGR